jgi:signal transduction histidine kinase/GAF domain-containing protein
VATSGPGATLPYSETFARTAQAVMGFTNATSVWIAIARPGDQTGALTPALALGRDANGLTPISLTTIPALIDAVFALARQDAYAIHSGNVAQDPRFAGVETRPFGSIFCAPIHDRGQPIAALVVARTLVQDFDSHQRALASVHAETIAGQVYLLDAVRRQQAQARVRAALNEAVAALASGLDPLEIINTIAGSINSVVAVDAALIYRFEPRQRKLRLITGIGVNANELAGATVSLAEERSLAAQVGASRKALYNVPLARDTSGSLTGVLAHFGPVSLICQPLVTQSRLLGVLMLARARPFDQFERQVSDEFVSPAAAALERAELFEDVRAQRDQRDAMFSSAAAGIAVVDDDDAFVEVNQAFAAYVGVEPKALLGQRCYAVFNESPGEAPSPARCRLCHGPCGVRTCLSGAERPRPYTGVFPPPARPARPPLATDGPDAPGREVEFVMTPVSGPAGLQVMLLGRDVTDERARERRRVMLLKTLAHEVRDPLGTAMLNLDLALHHTAPDLTAARRGQLERLARDEMSQASENLVDLVSLIERDVGLFSVTPEPGDLSVVALEAKAELETMAAKYGVHLSARAPEGLRPALIDQKRVKQLARNLLINAIKFTPAGGQVRISIAMGADGGAEWAFLVVQDTGVGIADEHIERIFERQYQVKSSRLTGRPEGSGMGLALARYIMEAHGCEKPRVISQPGKGSTFIARFPLA